MAIKLITDSTSDIPEEYVDKYNITVLPLGVSFGDEHYKDRVTLTNDDFYAKLRACTTLPKTNLVNQFEFSECFSKLDAGDEYIVITISSKMSGTYNAALTAAKAYKNIHVVDSLTVTFELGAIVLETAKMIESNMPLDDILNEIEVLKRKVYLVAVVDTLRYLKEGGRLSAAAAFIGTVLRVKPIISIIAGLVGNIYKAIGSSKAFEFIANMVRKERSKQYPVYFGYTHNRERMEEFITKYGKQLELTGEEVISSIGCVVGTHVGEGAVGAVYFRN